MAAMMTSLTVSKRHNYDLQKQTDRSPPILLRIANPSHHPPMTTIDHGLIYPGSEQFVSIAALLFLLSPLIEAMLLLSKP
jgi:hypothetical protein